MRDLLKADFKRVIKDKLILVLSIIALVFAVITPLLNKAILSLIPSDELEMLGMQQYAKNLFFSAFSPSNNFGIILPILVAIILCKDFSNGTIRNKIICGKSRANIYFSLLITCFTFVCLFIFAHAIITLLVSLMLFSFQPTTFTIYDFGYILASIGFEIVVYALICAILTFFVVYMKNAGLTIVMYFVLNFVMSLIGGLLQGAFLFADLSNPIIANLMEIAEFFNTSNIFISTIIGQGSVYSLKEILAILIPNVTLTVILIFLGLIVFKKKELK